MWELCGFALRVVARKRGGDRHLNSYFGLQPGRLECLCDRYGGRRSWRLWGVTAGGDYADYLYQNVKGGIEASNDPMVQKYFDDVVRDISGQASFDRDLANVGNSYAGLEQQARQQR